jgi:hypothetical protein
MRHWPEGLAVNDADARQSSARLGRADRNAGDCADCAVDAAADGYAQAVSAADPHQREPTRTPTRSSRGRSRLKILSTAAAEARAGPA